MDRRTLIAIGLIMAVLIGDQIFMSWWAKRNRPPQTAGVDSTAVVGMTPAGGGTSPGGTVPGAPQTGAPPGSPASGTPGSSTTAGGSTQGGLTAGAAGGASATVAISGAGPRVPAAPEVERGLKTALFDATFSSRGGTITRFVLPQYPDLGRGNAPVNLVPDGRRALRLWVSTPYFNYDFTDVPFRVEAAAAFDSSVTFVAEDSSGVKVRKRFRVSADSRALDLEIRISVPPEFGPIQYRYGWGSALPNTEKEIQPHDIRAVALVGDKQEEVDAGKIQKDGSRALKGNVRWVANRNKYFAAAILPDSATAEEVSFAPGDDGGAVVYVVGSAAPGTEVVRHGRLYAGPIHYDTLVMQGAELDRLANLGWR
jgi:YidC/Oxa1 family membrane protein insertase